MRVLHIVDSMDPRKGGVSEAVRSMATAFTQSGGYNEVLTLDDPEISDKLVPFQLHALGPSKGPWHYAKRLKPWLKENCRQFDIIIVHGLWLYMGFAVKRILLDLSRMHLGANLSVKDPKVFIMPHGMLDPYFQKSKHRKKKAVRNWLYWKMIEAGLVNKADGILFTCSQELILARQPFRPYQPKRELIVGLGVPTPPAFTPTLRQHFSSAFPDINFGDYILFLGRIDEKKGVDMLLQAYNKLVQRARSSSNAIVSSELGCQVPQLVIAGPGIDSPYGKKILQYVQSRPAIASSVFFTGMQQGDAKWSLLYGCEAFILPSHQENFGIAVVEALACRKPVLISNQVNIYMEICREQAALIANDTVEGTYNLLHGWVKTTPDERKKMQVAAEKCYHKNYAVQAATTRLWNALSLN